MVKMEFSLHSERLRIKGSQETVDAGCEKASFPGKLFEGISKVSNLAV